MSWQVGDEIVEINGEPARGISHTRAIELIQAGGNKVVLLLRPGAGLAQDGSKYLFYDLRIEVLLSFINLTLFNIIQYVGKINMKLKPFDLCLTSSAVRKKNPQKQKLALAKVLCLMHDVSY